jgi:hypothetical protein
MLKSGKRKCKHNRQKTYCKPCGGSGLCVHDRQKTKCKLASGSACEGLDKRRPDLLWIVEGKVAVVVEIDEHSHSSGYEPSCEVRTISEQNLAIQQSDGCHNIPVFTIRVNPDSYDVETVQKEKRADMVANKVKELLEGEYERNGYAKLFFCCYHTSSNHLIEEQMKHWDCEVLT